ncbi:hypothetical protein O181_032320 [Austropuccinia psidii MF-1]|uniref:Uncharacterized protein n=1 Tax=Austropuccinia psidii MF-1 TaxID=1389203 RepID=A0A9Q3D0T5_9BASI|nr:hypothetical protein [Austropuccinia psidii MF-1]
MGVPAHHPTRMHGAPTLLTDRCRSMTPVAESTEVMVTVGFEPTLLAQEDLMELKTAALDQLGQVTSRLLRDSYALNIALYLLRALRSTLCWCTKYVMTGTRRQGQLISKYEKQHIVAS